jgi:hypothetical protein
MKLVVILKNGSIQKAYSDGKEDVEMVELNLSEKEEAVWLPGKGWTDVSLCDIEVTRNRKFVKHVFGDEKRNRELERWQKRES